MNRRNLIILSALSMMSLSCASKQVASNHPPSKPNVIIILTDDAGYADFGFIRK